MELGLTTVGENKPPDIHNETATCSRHNQLAGLKCVKCRSQKRIPSRQFELFSQKIAPPIMPHVSARGYVRQPAVADGWSNPLELEAKVVMSEVLAPDMC